MHYNIIKAVAGARTRLRLPMVWKADAVAAEELPEAVFWVFIAGERVRVEKTQHSEDEYIFPALPIGQYAWDLVVDAQVVLHGVLKVRGSAVPPGGGEVCGTLLVDAPAMVLVLSPGPRGEVGPVGPQGLSAYEVALQHGFCGSEDDWAEELSGAQAAATVAKEQAKAAGNSATEAANSATTASEKATAAGNSAKEAAVSASTASEKATAAGNSAKEAAVSASTASEKATAAGNSAKAAADSATTASEKATAAGNSAKAAADSATTASEKATAAGNSAKEAAGSATKASEKAKAAGNSAKEAAVSAEGAAASATAAASTLAAAAKLADNNTYSGVNTFNGSLVANGPVTLPGAASVNGISMQDLQGMQTALSSFLSTLSPLEKDVVLQAVQGDSVTTWGEWVALNPNWAQQETLVFYAPNAKGKAPAPSSALTSKVKKSVWVSNMLPPSANAEKMLGSNFMLYCPRNVTTNHDLLNLYNALNATIILPKTKTFDAFAGNLGYFKSGVEMRIYAPELDTIVDKKGNNTTFYFMGVLSKFSIYAPKLAHSFFFSYATNIADTAGYALGQTCEVLQALIAGIGTPETEQTITTSTPQGTDDEIAALEAAAAEKNWKFEYVKVPKQV